MQIIDDILDLSKIEAGEMSVEKLRCSPVELASDVVKLMLRRPKPRACGCPSNSTVPLPATIQTDPDAAAQILFNIVGNATNLPNAAGSVCWCDCSTRYRTSRRSSSPWPILASACPANNFETISPLHAGRHFHRAAFWRNGPGPDDLQTHSPLLGGDVTVTSHRASAPLLRHAPTGPLEGMPMMEYPADAARAEA